MTERIADDPLGAFCRDSEAFLAGASTGPLAGLTFAAKDIFDVVGHVTGCGNPDWKATHEPAGKTAWAVEALVAAGATLVGKTITDELTRGILGENMHYGTPANPRAPGRVPGGSSSGSASAVAGGLVDFALGSDTGGSVRVPASFCGLYGLRPTHGRILIDGVMVQAPTFDTVGWFARDAELFARVGQVLLGSAGAPPARPSRIVIAEDAFALATDEVQAALRPIIERAGKTESLRLAQEGLHAWSDQQGVLQNREAWTTLQDWLERGTPRVSFEVADRYVAARSVTDEQVAAAQPVRDAVRRRIAELTADGAVICLPTTPTPAPPVRMTMTQRREWRLNNNALVCMAGLSGSPQISLPLTTVDGLPVGLSFIAAPGADEVLLALARGLTPR